MKREDLYGTRMHELEAHLPEKVRKERAQEALEWGLESAGSINRWRKSIEVWKPKQIQVPQLARNKCEVCFAVTM